VPAGSSDKLDPALPAISVVICAFTRERLQATADAIESVRSQSLPAHEIVLVIDHAAELLEESRARWPGITVIPNRETQGLSGARNSGLAETTGDVVAFLDDDAVAAPDWLEHLAGAYADHGVLGVGGTVRPSWVEGRPRWFPEEFDWVVGCTHSGMPRERSVVRNLVGANMSFRRDVLIEVGGFRHELTRVGKNPVGCEETDLCIRVGARWPDFSIVYDPAVSVDHVVPPTRSRPRYFMARCAAEGRSKAVLTLLVGSKSGLSSERSYVRRTLPLGFLRGVRDALRGDAAGAARAAMLGVGLLTTSVGYAASRGILRRPAPRSPGPEQEAARDRLRVLMVTPRNPLGQGGVERHVLEVSRRVAAAGLGVEVLCAEPGGPAMAEQRSDGVVIHSVRAWPAKRDYYLAPRIWREMARKPWDLVHVQSYHTLVAPLAMLRALTLGIPYVVTFHGGGHSSRLRNRLRRAQRRALRPLLARADRLVAVARFEIDLYGRELDIPRERFVLIPNGTDLAFADAAAGESPAEPGLLASIGRLERYKGHHRVIAALPHVLERQPEAKLMIVGTGPYEATLRSQAAELGVEDRVEFASVPAEDPSGMAALLQRVSLVVLLSEFETHPLVALEAAAAGRRLLVADRGGLAELAEDGLARAVSPDETPQAVGRAIVEELARPRQSRAPQLTSWDECADALLELYGSLA
jgi:glycosyltransferase involved in cell wall biosynthesis